MKKFILLLSVLCLSVTALSARGIPIPVQFGEQEKLEIVHDLPDTDDFLDGEDGQYIDLACYHKRFSIMWIPLWVTGEPKFVLMKKSLENTYWEINDETIGMEHIEKVLREENLDKEQLLSLGLFTRYGGKLVFALIIGLLIWGQIPSKNEDEEQEVEAKEL